MTSYDEILMAMQEKYYEATGFFADDASDIGIRLKVLAIQLSTIAKSIDDMQVQIFPQTALGEYLNYHAQTRGLRRKVAVAASGTLRFSRGVPSPTGSVIPAGVVCAISRGDDGIELRFKTTAQVTLPAGETFVDVPAEATQGGAFTNAAPNAITVMITPVQGVSAVINPTAFTGGVDGETDEQLRARLLRSFGQISNGTNAAFYYDFAMGFDGVASVNVVPRVTGKGTVGVYVAGHGTAAPEALVASLRTQLNAAKEINVDVSVQSARLKNVNITLELDGKKGADFDALKLACEEKLKGYFAQLSVGQSLLLAGIADALYHVDGLYNYKLLAPLADTKAAFDELFVLETTTISRMAVIT